VATITLGWRLPAAICRSGESVPDASEVSGRIVLAGAHGHGRWHLENVSRLAATSAVRLVGVCDPRPLDDGLRALAGDVPVSPDLARLVEETAADVTIVCTPIHTHTDLTLAAIDAGSHVLLEKPPAPTMAEYERLRAGVEASDRSCQIGFQSLGSAAIGRVASLVGSGAIGAVRGIGGSCAWVRDAAYYGRAPWAGRRSVDGIPVVDGTLTNPFAHAVVTSLALAGAAGPASLDEIEVELYHANEIEADDTACLRLRTAEGIVITIAATLAAERSQEPVLVVHGTTGRITLAYRQGTVELQVEGHSEISEHPSTDLLENLLRHVADRGVPLLVPLRATHSFMEVVEAIRSAPDPLAIPEAYRRAAGSGSSVRQVVPGIDGLVAESAETLKTFSELDVPWARPGRTTGLRPRCTRAGD
jgi:predicted dehydrogenase